MDSLFGDVQRMDKRQVSVGFLKISNPLTLQINSNEKCNFVVRLPSPELWNDCVIGINDLERFNGCNGK